MNRNFTSILALILVGLAFGFLTGCSSSSSTPPPPPPPTLAITATSGSGQKANVGDAFANMLVATVTSNGTAASGVTVTFTPVPGPAGQSCTPSATTATTASDGTASITCTANSTPGAYSVTATATGTTETASFTEGNTAPRVFVFYVNGLENSPAYGPGPVYYGIAGAVGFDSNGNILGGEQDYNDGSGFTSPGEPANPDVITAAGSSMTVNSTTGTGTLVLNVSASDPNVGVKGIEKFAVQFVNANHALIMQFDGSATSSGSFDLQTASSSVGGNFAFTLSGVDLNVLPVAYGGVFSNASGAIHGTYDENDSGKVLTGNTLSATDNGVGADVYGRGSITGFTDPNNGNAPISLVYYIVGAEVLRIIDVDYVDAMAGSAYGQGNATSFDSTVLSKDVFTILDNTEDELVAAAGQLVAANTAVGKYDATFTGEGDDDEGGAVLAAGTPGGVAGNYSFSNTVLGYGSMTGITGLGSIHTLGLYATDPTLNLLDPNNTTATNLGAALVLGLDDFAQPTGVVVPQGSIASDGSDLDRSYGFGAQAYVDNGSWPTGNVGWEYDFVGQATFASLAFTTGNGGPTLVDISDPFSSFKSQTPDEYTAVPMTGTAAAPDAAGRYTFPSATPFAVGPVGASGPTVDFTVVMYEAGPGLVFSLEEDTFSEWLGTFQEMSAGPLNAMRVKRGPLVKSQAKRKRYQ